MSLVGLIRPQIEKADQEFHRVLSLLQLYPSARFLPPFIASTLRIQQIDNSQIKRGTANDSFWVNCWLDGDIYNSGELAQEFSLGKIEDGVSLMKAAYEEDKLSHVLKKANGDFCAVLYDGKNHKLLLVSDRLGLKPLYYSSGPGQFFFCSQLKGMLGLSTAPKINPAAWRCFLDIGHLVGNLTWFLGTDLLPPATLLELDLMNPESFSKTRYWTWGDIKPQTFNKKESVENLCILLRRAVERRLPPNKRVSVLLSGGLDSRILAACTPKEYLAGTATFGRPGCRDRQYANQVAKVLGKNHAVYSLEENNWDLNRAWAVWKCDGMSGISDLHGSQFLWQMSQIAKINLNGFAGDIVAGGSFLDCSYTDQRPTQAFAEKHYGLHNAFDSIQDSYYDCPHSDPYILANRVRRLIVNGTRESEGFIEQRKPFMDSELLDFLYGFPDSWRRDGKLYHDALLSQWPQFFKSIPWQKTGVPLGAGPLHLIRKQWGRIQSKWNGKKNPREFHDYPSWFRFSKEKYATLLESKKAVWRHFINEQNYIRYFNVETSLMAGEWEKFSRAATIEIWLQQLFLGKYREPDVAEEVMDNS